MTATESLLKILPDDIGGLPADRVERVEHELEPWEKRCHALLDFHKIINTEEKRRGVEALGSGLISKLACYERWIAAFANILFQKQIFARGAGAEDGRSFGRYSTTSPEQGVRRTTNVPARRVELARDRTWREDAMSLRHRQKMTRRSFCLCCLGGRRSRTGKWLTPRQAFAEARGLVSLIKDSAATSPS